MPHYFNRRKFISLLGIAGAGIPFSGMAAALTPKKKNDFNFVFLGDLHFDKLMHHDMDYLKQRYPNDIVQIENYSRITRENLASLMRVSKEAGTEMDAKFYLQIGDFVEGLCGTKELATIQATELISYIEQQQFEKPFIAIKGNHDITGTGAKEMYADTVLPWQSKQLQQPVTSANNVFVHNKARFILFDCFSENESLEWFKTVVKGHAKDEVLFFCTHIPVVPFDARSNWHIYVKPEQQQRREELLNLLAQHKAIVLSGHLHKTSLLVRNTQYGNFVQVGIGSVVPSLHTPIKNHLKGLDAYNADLVHLEPNFSPNNLEERKQILINEKPAIRYYEYADFCGYSTVSVSDKNGVTLSIFANADKTPWTTINLTKLFEA